MFQDTNSDLGCRAGTPRSSRGMCTGWTGLDTGLDRGCWASEARAGLGRGWCSLPLGTEAAHLGQPQENQSARRRTASATGYSQLQISPCRNFRTRFWANVWTWRSPDHGHCWSFDQERRECRDEKEDCWRWKLDHEETERPCLVAEEQQEATPRLLAHSVHGWRSPQVPGMK